ncbi:NCS1 family nucleobase:cation symporter [Alkalihalobacillus sp. BA299]|uniref:NCS1 family nucleobase:cation symporter n=1 Tax=Alkalihalobacillus sp. BA299 TaxID=2815938 RepID=UPI001ADA6055|nr:NCS1 family nucleobase:cation symporter [Alkalihalobacillus sp. BA299]
MEHNEALLDDISIHSLDLRPTKPEARTLKFGHFFSLWMGSVHNIPSYVTIGGFFAIGLSISQVFFIILISAIILAAMMVLNGHAGYKYGIPFTMLLRTSFGAKGAILPGVLRGIIAAIMWFGLQTFAGSLAISILIGYFWPDFLSLGGNWNIFGLSLPNLLSFLIFWTINVSFIYGGITTLGRLTKVISPLVFIVFGGMSIWAINLAGGISPILSYSAKGVDGNSVFVIFTCISAILATWVAPILSVSDFTRFSRSNKDQFFGQIAGIVTTYLLFAIASISIIVGSEIAFGVPIWNVLEVVDKFDSHFAIVLSLLTVCLSTLSVNIVGNIIPAGNQLVALFPKRFTFKSGALVAAVIGILIMPWKLMESSTSIFAFLNVVGGLLSPVIGVMLAHYFFISKKEINVQSLYTSKGEHSLTTAINLPAVLAMLLAGTLSLIGNFIPAFAPLYSISWFTGITLSIVLYLVFWYFSKRLSSKMIK